MLGYVVCRLDVEDTQFLADIYLRLQAVVENGEVLCLCLVARQCGVDC